MKKELNKFTCSACGEIYTRTLRCPKCGVSHSVFILNEYTPISDEDYLFELQLKKLLHGEEVTLGIHNLTYKMMETGHVFVKVLTPDKPEGYEWQETWVQFNYMMDMLRGRQITVFTNPPKKDKENGM